MSTQINYKWEHENDVKYMFELRIWDTGNLCNFPYPPDKPSKIWHKIITHIGCNKR